MVAMVIVAIAMVAILVLTKPELLQEGQATPLLLTVLKH